MLETEVFKYNYLKFYTAYNYAVYFVEIYTMNAK